MHELMHGLGPHNITVGGRATTVRQELKETYSALEEAKADISGLWALQYLVDKGTLGKDLERTMYTTFLASCLPLHPLRRHRGPRQGHRAPAQHAARCGRVQGQPGRDVHGGPARVKDAVAALTREIMTLQAAGDYAKAKEHAGQARGRPARGAARARPPRRACPWTSSPGS